MPRTYVVEVDETKPAVRLIEGGTSAAAFSFVAKQTITVRLASQTDMYEAGKKGIETEKIPEPVAIP